MAQLSTNRSMRIAGPSSENQPPYDCCPLSPMERVRVRGKAMWQFENDYPVSPRERPKLPANDTGEGWRVQRVCCDITVTSPSPRPSPLGRGRIVGRLSTIRSARIAGPSSENQPPRDGCSLSPREKVGPSPRKNGFGPAGRVRGNQAFLIMSRKIFPGTAELFQSSGRAGGFPARR